MTMKEFKARLESDAAFRAKFADVKTEEEFVKVAKAEGIDFETLSDDDLDNVAGGGLFGIDWDLIKRAWRAVHNSSRW